MARPALWIAAALALLAAVAPASEGEKPVARDYALVTTPPAPRSQTQAAADAKSIGCLSCHTASDEWTMHAPKAVVLGCTDCHGGNTAVAAPAGLDKADPAYARFRDQAHVLPRYPQAWHFPSSANPKRSYTLLNKEAPEFIRFVNPSDYRVARDSCGACHLPVIEAAERSLMATGAMLFGGASYNNGIAPYKNYIFGESYTRRGAATGILSHHADSIGAVTFSPGTSGRPAGVLTEAERSRGALPFLVPLPAWQVLPPGDIFRVFERGGRNINPIFPEIGNPGATGLFQRLEEPGRPDIRQSNRGPGTGLRVAVPVINIHKTRLNDPFTWFMGTNDQPGDYRTSGCASCHVVYANDRDPVHSSTYAAAGRDGTTQTADPTIPRGEPGHPIRHAFTRAIPSAQCMNCHMHQPNMFLNSYYGTTMWDYEADAPRMWPAKQRHPTAAETREINERNPEAAAARGLWADPEFLRTVADRNPANTDTQFADYHGHGWNFRAVYKRDREGNLLDAGGNMATYGTDTAHIIANNDPQKWRRAGVAQFPQPAATPGAANGGAQGGKAVHMMSIHAEVGMQCADCHFAQDGHDNGYIHGEVANAVEVSCKDCHGTADAYPSLKTSNVNARPGGTDLTLIRNPDGRPRFEWVTQNGREVLLQRSASDPKLEWRIHLTRDSVTRGNPDFNEKAARAKLISRTDYRSFGPGVPAADRAHGDDNMACYTCHLSWTTSCGGCHLPIEANWKSPTQKYEDQETRNFATYNPQVARDDMFQLGRHQTTKGNIIAPVRSSSALMLSSTNINRERIYVQQPPISAAGYSSQAFAPHYPHTERREETKTCTDCHLAKSGDNNAIMAQLLLTGTNFVNFIGAQAWVGTGVGLDGGIEAVRVTEYSEPQAVFGSYLQKYAYPDYWRQHVERNGRELIDWVRGKIFDRQASGETDPSESIGNVRQRAGGAARCLQARGEYLYVAEGKGGFRAYDIASIANKGVSDKIVTAPFSPLGQNTRIASKNATCMALATTQPIAVGRNDRMIAEQAQRAAGKIPADPLGGMNQEQAMHPLYRYAVITDAEEGLILTDIDTLNDGEPRNNFLKRARVADNDSAWNPDSVLTGARHITLAGHFAYVATPRALVVVDLDDPLHPRLAASVAMADPRASALQFRYLWVTTARGLEVLDVTRLDRPRPIPAATVPIADARRVYVARTYAYVAAKRDGLVIIDVKRPTAPTIYQRYTADGKLNDAEDVVIGSTNASLFAYVADGANGMKVLQLMSPASQPNFYGFSPKPMPELIAWARTRQPALAMSKGLDRDRAVDETGHQIAVMGRLGSRPFTRPEMEKLFIGANGEPWFVEDRVNMADWSPRR
ncbi:multiheme c-type cytochrome [Sandarakinorhabdus sp. DWP1-3-1]|uniref:LVIVD repeat-containing protein n=1 Tax=Sandarakinorhabdus sp. DWP1-3-1 TaxID=2804627 RepID=UPI003CF27854